MLTVNNSGQDIAATNYWDSEQARAGYVFVSWNAGACRVLLPDSQKAMLTEMRTAQYVVISRGPWPEQRKKDALELMFEDHTDSPFCLHVAAEQCDRLILESDQGGGTVVAVWTRDGMQLQLPARYRIVGSLPCMDAWIEQ